MRAVTRGKNFAPDQTYELSKRGQVGPLSATIAQIFQRHADLWAEDVRTCASRNTAEWIDEHWRSCMGDAELEVGRFLAGRNLTSGAAA